MPDFAVYSFRLQKTSYKTQDLIYEEPGYKLIIDLEISGVKQFDWVGSETDLLKWDIPTGKTILPEKCREILNRLTEWSQRHRARIGIGPSIEMQAYFSEGEQAGSRVERRSNGIDSFIKSAIFPRVELYACRYDWQWSHRHIRRTMFVSGPSRLSPWANEKRMLPMPIKSIIQRSVDGANVTNNTNISPVWNEKPAVVVPTL